MSLYFDQSVSNTTHELKKTYKHDFAKHMKNNENRQERSLFLI